MESSVTPASLEEDPRVQEALFAALQQELQATRSWCARPDGDDAPIRRRSAELRESRIRSEQARRESREQELQTLRSNATGRGQQLWQVQIGEDRWENFAESEQQCIQTALANGQRSVRFQARGFEYEILLDKLAQRNVRTGKERPIRLGRAAARDEAPRTGEQTSATATQRRSRSCVACTLELESEVLRCPLCGTLQPRSEEPDTSEPETSQPDRPERTVSGPTMACKTVSQASDLRSIELCCNLAGNQFTDPDFPPILRGQVTSWKRPSEVTHHDGRPLQRSEDWQLFRGKPQAQDVRQGGLGDCWFLSALAALAEFQDGCFVRNLLPGQDKLSPAGAYIVRLCLGGRWHEVIVDDRFPCSGGGRYHTKIAYCTTYRLQLWASLIEKGFAKACGSYEALIGGHPSEALSVLTGWPCTVIRFIRKDFDKDILWASLVSSRDAGFLTTCSTYNIERSSGLVPNHAYSLIDVFQVDTPGMQFKLLKIRNPHANYTWRGPWSDSSKLWTPELRHQLQYPEGGSAGIFFMSLEDFIWYFSVCTICKIRSGDWCEARVPLQLPTFEVPHIGYELEVFETTDCAFVLAQPEERTRGGSVFTDLFEPYTCVGFVVMALESTSGAELRPAAGRPVGFAKMRCREALSAECMLQAGRRYLLIPLSANDGMAIKATCACMSNRPVVMKRCHLSPLVVQAGWAAYAKSGTSSSAGKGVVYQQKTEGGGSIVIFAENRSDAHFHVDVSFLGDGLRFSRGWAVTTDWIPPSHGQILQVVVPDTESDGSIGWQYKLNFKLSAHATSRLHTPDLPSDSRDPQGRVTRTGTLHAPFRLS